MLPSEVPRLATDLPVIVFPGVWKPLFLKTPFPGWISVPPSFVSLFIFYIFSLPLLEDNGLPFWVPDVLCQHSEVVLWNLLSVQMFFGWICRGESGLPILFLCHLRTTAPPPQFFFFFNKKIKIRCEIICVQAITYTLLCIFPEKYAVHEEWLFQCHNPQISQ